MATEVGSAFVTIVPSARGFGRALQGQVGPQAAKTGVGAGRSFGGAFTKATAGPVRGLAGVVSGPLVGALGAFAGVQVFGKFIGDARESAKVARLTENVIRSTGGAAKISAAQVGDLATSISNKTGIDDEAIQSGENLLLTFTNIKNQAGAGNDIFNQTTRIMTDMSAALGTDAKGSAIQLGKALNNPVKGVSALSRVGVSFTDQQKEQIKTLVASGKTMDAQKVILSELGKEFGGAAEASADPMAKLQVTLGNLGESIGGALLPVIDRFANYMIGTLIPAGQRFAGFLRTNVGPALKRFGAYFTANVLPQLRRFGEFLATRIAPALKSFGGFLRGTVFPALQRFGGFISTTVIPALRTIGTAIATQVLPALLRLGGFIKVQLAPAFRAMGDFLRDRMIPAYRGFAERIKQVLPTVLQLVGFLGKVIGVALAVVAVILGKLIPVFLKVAGPIFTLLFAAIGKILGITAGLIRIYIKYATTMVKVGVAIAKFVVNAGQKFAEFHRKVREAIGRAIVIIAGLPGKAFNALQSLRERMLTAARTGFGKLISGATEKVDALVGYVKEIPGKIVEGMGDLYGLLLAKGKQAIQGLIDGIASRVKDVGSAAGDIAGKIGSFWPGSPVKEGPLRVLNRGRAGGLIATMLADGITGNLATVGAAAKLMSDTTAAGFNGGNVIPITAAHRPTTIPITAAAFNTAGISGQQPPIVQVFIDGHEIDSAVVRVVDRRDLAFADGLHYRAA